jgi:hypothetical protein
MKKSVLLTMLIFFSVVLMTFTQEPVRLTAYYNDANKVVQVENDKSFSVFTLNADQATAEWIVQKSSEYGKYLQFTLDPEKEKNGQFRCKLSFNHNARSFEFYKMFNLYGIEQVSIEGKVYPLNQLLQF